MSILEIKYLKNEISDFEFQYIKKCIPKKYDECLHYKSIEARNLTLLSKVMTCNNLNISENDIKYNKLKKPYIENGLFFNVSHSKDYVIFAKSNQKIGIDIELVSNNNMKILDYVYNEDEKKYIMSKIDNYSDTERFTRLWTIKESLFKASGSEEYLSPKDIVIIRNENEICDMRNNYIKLKFLDDTYNVYSLKFLDYIVSVASIEKYDDIKFVEDKIIYSD